MWLLLMVFSWVILVVYNKSVYKEHYIVRGNIMQINWVIVRIFGVLVVVLHLAVAALLLFALYAKSDPETAARLVQSIEWYRLLNPSFEMILALIFLVYVILVGSLSVLLNISKRMDESVSVLGEIRDLLKDQNSGQKPPSLVQLAERSLRR